MSAPATARLQALLEPVVIAVGCDLEEITVTPAGRRRLVRVMVDRDGGVTLDDVAAVSTAVSEALDDAEPFGEQPYVLEVTSPGVDRPLTAERHWRRAIGRLVRVRAADAELTGRVLEVRDGAVLLGTDSQKPKSGPATGPAQRLVPVADLGPGRVQVEFRHADESDGPEAVESDAPELDEYGGPEADAADGPQAEDDDHEKEGES